MASIANYQHIDSKIGSAVGGVNSRGPAVLQWTANMVAAAGAQVQNGAFIYKTSAGGTAGSAPGPTPNNLTDNTITWVLVGPVSPFCVVDATQQQELGYQALGKDISGGYGTAQFRYVKFTGTCAPGDFVVVDQSAATATQTPTSAPGANKPSILGICMGSPTTGQYGWVMLQGVHDAANVRTTFTAGAVLSGIGTAGAAQGNTTVTSNYVFDGTVLRSGSTAGSCIVEIYWPVCSGR